MTQGEWLIDRLGDLHGFCSAYPRLGKFSQFDRALDKVDTGKDGGKARLTEALVVPLTCEERHIPPVVVCRLAIIAQSNVGEAQKKGRHHLQGEIVGGLGNGERAV